MNSAVSDRTPVLRVAVAQLHLPVGDLAGNGERILAAARRARDELRAGVVVFPELALTGYPPEDLLLRPDLGARVVKELDWIATRIPDIDVVVGHPEPSPDGLYNAASLLRGGAREATYRKHHLPNYGVFDEKRYFVPGAAPCVFRSGGLAIGVTICEDMWAAGPAAWAAQAGAQVLVNLNASPFHVDKGSEREGVLRERVAEAGVPIVYVNTVGGQDELVFDGASTVMDTDGYVTHRGAAFDEGLYAVDLDAAGRPLPGRMQDYPDADGATYRAITVGVRDYVTGNGFRGALVGLSGGIDSALTLAVAVDALGADNVEAVMMPSRYTSPMSLEDATSMARTLGVTCEHIPIEPPFTAFLDVLADAFKDSAPDVTEENIQARCRGIILMALSNKRGRMVLTTGNKSELAVGYATLYGDMAGGFAPLKDVSKTTVYRLARLRNEQGVVIPERVITRPPSAELAPDQRDEDSLPPYDVLDEILTLYVEQDRSVAEIVAAGYDKAVVRRVAWMVDRNEYKRRQAPPGVRVTRRAFGRDRRYPITVAYRYGDD